MHNSEGEVLVSFSIPKALVHSPIVAEALALWSSMQIWLEMGFNHIVFKGDCQAMSKATKTTEDNRSEISPIVHDIRFLLQQRADWDVRFINREENEVANILANLATIRDSEIFWVEKCVGEVLSLVQKDKYCND